MNCNGQCDADRGAHGVGAGDEVVLYRVTYDQNTITGLLDPLIAPNGTVTLEASIAVRNEPFPGGETACPSS